MSLYTEKIFTQYNVEKSTDSTTRMFVPKTIGAVIMCKNEEKRITVTLNSIVGIVNCVIVYDTGSTDSTKEIITDYCTKKRMNLHFITGEFVDFSTSRNVLLDYADTIPVEFLLLLDVNDELQGGKELLKFISSKDCKDEDSGFLLVQMWKCYTIDRYFNVRMIRAGKNWRYRGSVHEHITDGGSYAHRVDNYDVVIFQDRTKDDDKSMKRFAKDKVLLLKDYKENPNVGRTVFYLAQTCSCLNQLEESYYYYKLRTELGEFFEERFISFNKLGELGMRLGHSWPDCMKWFMLAYECIPRAEPLVRIAEYYITKEKWMIAFMFIHTACELDYPHHFILFVDKAMYDYYRWHLLGRVGFYAGKAKEGKIGCEKALAARPDSVIDKQNYECYLQNEAKTTEIENKTAKLEHKEHKHNVAMMKRTLNKQRRKN